MEEEDKRVSWLSKRKRQIAFLLVMAMMGTLFAPISDWNGLTGWASAAETQQTVKSPENTGNIPTTGDAVTMDLENPITGLEVEEQTTTSIRLIWDSMEEAEIYYLYQYDFESESYVYLASTTESKYFLEDLTPGQEFYFTVCGYKEETKFQSGFAMPVHAYTRPEKVETFTFKANTATTITLSWKKVESATGYQIYRAATTGNFSLVDTTDAISYKDTGLTSGKTYRYMIRTYGTAEENTGEYSPALSMTTLPKAPSIQVKGGSKKARITWNAITGASGYYVYRYNGSKYVSIAKLEGKSKVTYINTKLKNGTTYKYQVAAYRNFQKKEYQSTKSSVKSGKVAKVKNTSTIAKLFKTKKAFKKSAAYQLCEFFKKKVNYAKSIILPGLSYTNVADFGCSSMVPQGMTFAKSYLLVSAYDSKKSENSVIYVIKKSNKKLMTTVVLPTKIHAGGISYDGTNIWITGGTSLRSIPFASIQKAASAKKKYLEIDAYSTKNELGQQAGSVTYYKGFLWVASYNELSSGYMGCYRISNKKKAPSLAVCSRVRIPNRVQGLAFTTSGQLIFSRSCQTDASKRGFFHRLDVYKPNVSNVSNGKIALGKVKNTVDMPTMNEEIAISGKYLYVNYESGAFSTAVKRMDRICAFKVTAVTQKKAKTKAK